jgi:hypothetical protein
VVVRWNFEWALDSEKTVKESSVWAIIDAFIGGELRLEVYRNGTLKMPGPIESE